MCVADNQSTVYAYIAFDNVLFPYTCIYAWKHSWTAWGFILLNV